MPDGTPIEKDIQLMTALPLTGFTPLQHDLDAESKGSENVPNQDVNGWHKASPSGPRSDAEKRFQETHTMSAAESMHLACKVLLLLVKFRSEHVKVG